MPKRLLIKTIRFYVILALSFLGVVLLSIHTYKNITESNARADEMRQNFIKSQRHLVKDEVSRVVVVIDASVKSSMERARDNARARVREAHLIAHSVYNQNRGRIADKVIQTNIVEALRPIRFNEGDGYYFITDFLGNSHLSADTPEREGTNLLEVRDAKGKYVIRDMIEIARNKGEGFYSYNWTKPQNQGDSFEKVSFFRQFEPFNWFIGTGVYMDTVESNLQQIITEYVTNNRFGPNQQGYVFINEILDINGGSQFGRVYANPNRPNDTGKIISDEYIDAKGKMFRKEFLQGLRQKGECYVDYWYHKLDSKEPSLKTSFFKLAANGRFMVAAGVYTDDVESEIEKMHMVLQDQLLKSIAIISSIFLFVIVLLILLFNYLSKRVENDFKVFTNFFKRAAYSSEHIEKELIVFNELDQLADAANRMLEDKTTAEKQLHNERERLHVTLHSIGEGVIATSIDGTVLLLSRVAENLTGWFGSEGVGRNIAEIMQTKEDGHAATFDDVLKNPLGNNGNKHQTLVSRMGTEYMIESNSTPITGDGGGILGQVIVFRDETEKLQTENELRRAQKLESVSFLAGGIAHDFNNILAGIFGNIELAKMTLSPDQTAYSYIQLAFESLQRAKNLTSQLLTFAKGGDPVIATVDLRQMIPDVVSFNLSGSSVKAVYEISESLWPIRADEGQISQVLSNLVINAKQAMTDGGTLTLHTSNHVQDVSALQTDSVLLEIRDTGIGMSEEVAARIFDPYFSTKQTGSGLGLSMVHSIVEKHAGKIEVYSRYGEGTLFKMHFPADRSQDKAISQLTLNPTQFPFELSLKILVVDDEESVLSVLVDMLSHYGHKVDTASEGKAGVEQYIRASEHGHPYDIVLHDLTIPGGMGGKEATQELLQLNPNIRIIAISGYATDPIMAQYQKFGFLGRIAKPFKLQEVVDEILRVRNL